jgi:hypothetical protein
MTRYLRGIFIVWVALRYGLDELVLNSFRRPWLSSIARVLAVGRDLRAPRGQRLRQALEHLGPIFVKFGQVLSTRRDLLPVDIADELAQLQDNVPPFDSAIAMGASNAPSAGRWTPSSPASSANRWPARRSRRCTSRRSRTATAASATSPSRCCGPACCP